MLGRGEQQKVVEDAEAGVDGRVLLLGQLADEGQGLLDLVGVELGNVGDTGDGHMGGTLNRDRERQHHLPAAAGLAGDGQGDAGGIGVQSQTDNRGGAKPLVGRVAGGLAGQELGLNVAGSCGEGCVDVEAKLPGY